LGILQPYLKKELSLIRFFFNNQLFLNISNLKPQVLERFNDLFNFEPKLVLNEDYCNTFTDKIKEWSNFNDNFRIMATSQLENFSNLSDAAKSRFSIVQTSEYKEKEKKIFYKLYYKDIPSKLYAFVVEFKKNFKKKDIYFSYIIKIISLYKKLCLQNTKYEEEMKAIEERNLALSIYKALYPLMINEKKRKNFYIL